MDKNTMKPFGVPPILFFVSAVSGPALGDVLYVEEAGFKLENSYITHAPPGQVWDALVNHVGQWWPADQ